MWIKDHYGRLVNAENIVFLEVTDMNVLKKAESKLWVITAHITQRDRAIWIDKGHEKISGIRLYLTEGFVDKEEAVIRMERIAEGIANGADVVALD